MNTVVQLESKLRTEALEYCTSQWGWFSPPESIVTRALRTLRYKAEDYRVGDIIADLKLLPSSRIEKLEAERKSLESAVPLLDYIIQNDTTVRDFPSQKPDILAYRNEIQYFEDIHGFDNRLRIHPDMGQPDVSSAAYGYKAVLMLIDDLTPVLVFSEIGDDYERFVAQGRFDQANNPLRRRYVKLVLAVGKLSQIMTLLRGNYEVDEKLMGRSIVHIALALDESSARKKVAAIHDYAVRNKATDIHISPEFSSGALVEVRINTNLTKCPAELQLTNDDYQQVKSYLINVSGAVVNSQLLQRPADGSYTYRMPNRNLDARCVFIPMGQDLTVQGNNVLIRIRLLEQTSGEPVELTEMRVSPEAIRHFKRAVRSESGMSLMVGPTGSGKSTSQHGMVNEHFRIFGGSKSRIAIEDPVERRVPNLHQVQVTELLKREFKNPYLELLRYFLRGDPDFLMLGEIRDTETMEAAGYYSNTGHLVLGTLHANDSVKAIERIVTMLERQDVKEMIIDSLQYIFAQRLIAELCPYCKEQITIDGELKADLVSHVERGGFSGNSLPATAYVQAESGCKKCGNSGVSGPIPVNEVLEITDEVKEIIFSNAPDKKRQLRLRRSMTLHEEILKLVIAGKASVKDLFKC